MRPPVWNCQRLLPVSASRAKKLPSSKPPKTRPPAVDNRPAQGGRMELELPHQPTGHDVKGPDGAGGLVAAHRLFAAAQEGSSRLVLRLTLEVVGPHLADGHVEESRPRAVRGTEPVGGSLEAGPNERPFFAGKGIGETEVCYSHNHHAASDFELSS